MVYQVFVVYSKLVRGLVQWSLRSLETLSPEVAPSLHALETLQPRTFGLDSASNYYLDYYIAPFSRYSDLHYCACVTTPILVPGTSTLQKIWGILQTVCCPRYEHAHCNRCVGGWWLAAIRAHSLASLRHTILHLRSLL